MIGLLCSGVMEARLASARLESVDRRADGPFFVSSGMDSNGTPWRIYETGPGRETSYAAARLAARRGAAMIAHLGMVVMTPMLAQELELEPGDPVIISEVYDLQELTPMQQLMGTGTREVPIPFPITFPGFVREILVPDDAPVIRLGTLAIPLTNPALGREVFKRYQIGAFDTEGSGVADGAADSGLPAVILKVCTAVAGSRVTDNQGSFVAEHRLTESIEAILEELHGQQAARSGEP